MWLKSCPRCGGDLYNEEHIDGTEVACLQCAHRLNYSEIRALKGRKTETKAA